MKTNPKTFFLKLTACLGIAGEICKPGTIVELLEHEAKDLLSRGKAKLATEDDVKNADAGGGSAAQLPAQPQGVPNGYIVSESSGKWGWVKGDGETQPEAMAGPFDTQELALADAVAHAEKAAA
jgi:hypothetical protein